VGWSALYHLSRTRVLPGARGRDNPALLMGDDQRCTHSAKFTVVVCPVFTVVVLLWGVNPPRVGSRLCLGRTGIVGGEDGPAVRLIKHRAILTESQI